MKKIACFALAIPMFLTACSIATDNHNSSVIVENAQESVRTLPPGSQPGLIAEPVIAKDEQTLQKISLGTAPVSDEPVGGSLEQSMDNDDKIKMARALDKSPGKTSSWTNNRTRIQFNVTPLRKIVLKDNPFCRTYQMTASRGSSIKEVSGTACISQDGEWHPI